MDILDRELIHRTITVSERIALEAIQVVQVALAYVPEGSEVGEAMNASRARLHRHVERLQTLVAAMDQPAPLCT